MHTACDAPPHVCMYVCISVCTDIYKYEMYACMSVTHLRRCSRHIRTYVYVCTYVCMYVCIYVCTYVRTYVCTLRTYVCTPLITRESQKCSTGKGNNTEIICALVLPTLCAVIHQTKHPVCTSIILNTPHFNHIKRRDS